jgi:hypothetical protein
MRSWQDGITETHGYGWWKDRDKLANIARDEALGRGPQLRGGVAVGRVGVKIRIDMQQLDNRLRTLPEKLALTIQRKALRKGLLVWQRTLQGLFGQHRTDLARPHLADHVATVSRVYRKRSRKLVWGAVGIRMGQATAAQMRKASRITARHGADIDQTAARASGAGRASLYELPGWRLHFLEGGTRGHAGTGYFAQVMDAQGAAVEAVIAAEISALMKGIG